MKDLTERRAVYLDDAIEAINKYFARIGKLKRGGLTILERAIKSDTLDAIKALPPAQPERKAEELLPDGTLLLFTDTDLSKVNRVLVSQNGTHYGDLYYADEWRLLV